MIDNDGLKEQHEQEVSILTLQTRRPSFAVGVHQFASTVASSDGNGDGHGHGHGNGNGNGNGNGHGHGNDGQFYLNKHPLSPPLPPPLLPPPPRALHPPTSFEKSQVQLKSTSVTEDHTPTSGSNLLSASTLTHEPTATAKLLNENNLYKNPSDGKLATFMRSGSSFPILVLTHNRPHLLEKTLTSLLQVRGIHRDRIFIAQDGHNPAVLSVVRKFGLKVDIHENPKVNGPPWKVGAVKIARHYKWSFSRMFEVFDRETPAAIVVEDDLLFSPDFLEYFHAVAPLVESDPTLWAASSWNDNGFDYLVKDPHMLKRTGFFPGLGWCMTRTLWDELGPKWPNEHWDHWLRQPEQHQGREVVIPSMPRVYHNGIKGTFMDRKTHNAYFARIATNRDPLITWKIPWDYGGKSHRLDPNVGMAEGKSYRSRLEQMIKNPTTHHVMVLSELQSQNIADTTETIVLWINVNVNPRAGMPHNFKPIARFFGVWHEARRGAHRGVHEFWIHGGRCHVLLVNVHPSVGPGGFGVLRPSKVNIFRHDIFRGSTPLAKGAEGVVQGLGLVGFHEN